MTQSRARTSCTCSSCHASPEPSSTKYSSSDAPCEWGGVGSLPGATRTRLRPTPTVPAAAPRRCHVASISPLARWWRSTSSQCATPLTRQRLRLRDVDRERPAAERPLHLKLERALSADLELHRRALGDDL